MAAALPGFVRAFPGTLVLVAAFITIGALTATVLRDQHPDIRRYVGWDLDTLRAGRYWRQLPGTLIQGQPGFKWHQPVVLIALVGWLESEVGARKALVTFFLCDWLSAPVATTIVWAFASLGSGSAEALLHLPSSGASAASIGAGAAAAALLPGRWGVPGAPFMLAIVVHSFTYQKLDASFAHLFATLVGIGLSAFLWRKEGR